jgi:hypothetical protein
MHTYQQRWADDPPVRTLPNLGHFRFTKPLDVVAWAELDPVLHWRSSPDVWHLDSKGRFRCGSQGSSFDSVQTFAEDLDALLACRQTELGWPCPNRWLILESRHPWHDPYHVGEDDERAFAVLRRALVGHGITLLDVMVFDQEFHWWSLHELTSGTTTWP